MKLPKTLIVLLIIIGLAAFFRLYHLTYYDSYTDESILAFRSIGLIDYDASLVQTTPWQWVEAVPWWGHLSLHDHPIFFFLLQHFFIQLFGENLWGVRLLSVVTGLLSVLLIYLVGREIGNRRVGYLAAAILAVQSYHVWVSRVGIQDGVATFFVLLVFWLWLKALHRNEWWYWIFWGISLGLAIITKYTVLIVIPVCLLYALVYRQQFLRNKFFWAGVLAVIIFSSPTWIYNICLYKNFGHFDFQFSALVGQDVPQWQYRQGREQVGGLTTRFELFFLSLQQSDSPFFNLLIIFSVIYSLIMISLGKKLREYLFFLLSLISFFLWFLIIGSTYRFVVMIIPWLILLLAYVFAQLNVESQKRKVFAGIILGIFLLIELLFTFNSFLLPRSLGKENLTYAQLNAETQSFGFNELDDYLNKILTGKVSYLFGQPNYQFLTDIQNKNIDNLKKDGADPLSIIVIYDKGLNFLARLWVFERRVTYYGWPIMSDETFLSITGDKLADYYRAQGMNNFVYIVPIGSNLSFNGQIIYQPSRGRLEDNPLLKSLEAEGVKPEILRNKSGEDSFAVYRF